MVGDETGFVTSYELGGLLKALHLDPIRSGVKYVHVGKGLPSEEQSIGSVL